MGFTGITYEKKDGAVSFFTGTEERLEGAKAHVAGQRADFSKFRR